MYNQDIVQEFLPVQFDLEESLKLPDGELPGVDAPPAVFPLLLLGLVPAIKRNF